MAVIFSANRIFGKKIRRFLVRKYEVPINYSGTRQLVSAEYKNTGHSAATKNMVVLYSKLEQSTLYVSYYSINLNQKFMLHVNEIFY
jgi:hypothetical protein